MQGNGPALSLVVDADRHLQLRRQIGFQGAGIGVLVATAGRPRLCGMIGRCGLPPHQILGLTDRQAVVDDAPRQGSGIFRGNQGTGMTCRQLPILDIILNLVGQVQKPKQVGDVAAALV